MVKMTATRSRSECLNVSRNKHAGDEKPEKKQKLLFQCAISGWSKRNSLRKLLDACKLVGCKQKTPVKTTVHKKSHRILKCR